jgi:hypothetical protein
MTKRFGYTGSFEAVRGKAAGSPGHRHVKIWSVSPRPPVTHKRLLGTSLDSGSARRSCEALTRIRDYLAREGDPIFADRLASVLLARVIQTDTLACSNERRHQISSELDFLVIVAVRAASSHPPTNGRRSLTARFRSCLHPMQRSVVWTDACARRN